MDIHVVIDLWGDEPGEQSIMVFPGDRAAAEKCWEDRIFRYWESSNLRDSEVREIIAKSRRYAYCHHHGTGYIQIITRTV